MIQRSIPHPQQNASSQEISSMMDAATKQQRKRCSKAAHDMIELVKDKWLIYYLVNHLGGSKQKEFTSLNMSSKILIILIHP